MAPLIPGTVVTVEYRMDWVMINGGQRIPILGGIPAGEYIVLEDLGKRVTLLPKGGDPVTTYKL